MSRWPIACHNPQGPVAVSATAQLAFATPNYLIQEVVRSDVPWRDDVVIGPVRIEGGIGYPPAAPGKGIEVNETEGPNTPT